MEDSRTIQDRLYRSIADLQYQKQEVKNLRKQLRRTIWKEMETSERITVYIITAAVIAFWGAVIINLIYN